LALRNLCEYAHRCQQRSVMCYSITQSMPLFLEKQSTAGNSGLSSLQ
jgi:hypothetical protein